MTENQARQDERRLSDKEADELLETLKKRFDANPGRHQGIAWDKVEAALRQNPGKLWSLGEMERTGGEPDVVALEKDSGRLAFVDCSPESPSGRRSVCYDQAALDARRENKPWHSALGMAEEMGISVLDEARYRDLQNLGKFDQKTSSWILTPPDIRRQDGGLFCNRHYGLVFLYYNGVQSYYAARGFRGILTL